MIQATHRYTRNLKWAVALMLMFIALFILDARARGARASFDEQRYRHFVQTLVKFHRKINGCPSSGVPPQIECVAGQATFDAKLWKELQDEAQGTF